VSFSALCALALTGCAGIATLPDTPLPSSSAQPGSIQGSVFGGHAPIVGAHVYVLQAGTGGYATASTNLITSGGASSDAHGNYVLTASDGSFNVTGDYACTVGYPVYLAATGGQTSDNIGGSNYSTSPISISSATSTEVGTTSEYLLTFTGNNLLYPGQSVVFSNLTGAWAGLNGGATQIIGANDNSFSILYGSNITGTTSGTAVPQSAINPAIANLAVLGNCPSTGNFSTGGTGSDVISYVYMNEVSTTAAAYALSGFGSGPFHVGIPASDALALTGIQNAANNAGQLYSIQGKYLSTTFAGEGHIASPTTPAGNGIVPQATLDTLGNILASCVDSSNLGNSATNPTLISSGASSSCSKLFTYATSNGIPYGTTGAGASPTDTATAAFNIAHYPAGNAASSSSFMAGLFILQGTETTPFSPSLSAAPNDFTIAINYPSSYTTGTVTTTVPYLVGPQAVSIDASGDMWFTSQPTAGSNASGYIAEFSPLGVKLYSNLNSGWMYGDIAIDSTGDAWTGNQGNYVLATEVLPPHGTTTTYTTELQGSSYTYAQGVTANGVGDVFVPHGPTTQTNSTNDNDQTLTELDTAGVVAVGSTGNMDGSFPVAAYMTHGAIDSTSAIWFTSNNGNVITRVSSSTGTAITGFPINGSTATTACPSTIATTILNPEQPSIDASNNAWVPLYNSGAGTSLVEVSSAGACSAFSGFNGPYGTAIDGADNLWVTNRNGSTLSEVSTSGGTTLTPSTGYTAGGVLSGPQGIAVDLSGDLIIANYTGNSLIEVIGAATPTYAPLGVAAGKTKLGATP
jgi:hypothetical protein